MRRILLCARQLLWVFQRKGQVDVATPAIDCIGGVLCAASGTDQGCQCSLSFAHEKATTLPQQRRVWKDGIHASPACDRGRLSCAPRAAPPAVQKIVHIAPVT